MVVTKQKLFLPVAGRNFPLSGSTCGHLVSMSFLSLKSIVFSHNWFNLFFGGYNELSLEPQDFGKTAKMLAGSPLQQFKMNYKIVFPAKKHSENADSCTESESIAELVLVVSAKQNQHSQQSGNTHMSHLDSFYKSLGRIRTITCFSM